MNEYKKNFMKRANRNLSNRADGMETVILENADPNVDQGLGKVFGFTVANGTQSNTNIALVPANFDTERFTISNGAVVKTYDNIDALNKAGFMVGAVLSDGHADYTSDLTKTVVDMTCTSTDPSRTIKQLLDYIKFNPQRLKHVDIISSDKNMFNGNLSVTFCNPFYKNRVQEVQMTTFFSRFQYSEDRIGIDFADNSLEFSDLLLLTATIPAEATVQFILKFY